VKDYVDITVRDAQGMVYKQGRYQLPVTFGRLPYLTIALPSDRQDISRTHLTLRNDPNGLVIEDSSVNGTVYSGRKLESGETVSISSNDHFSILDYTIEVARARPDASRSAVFDIWVSKATQRRNAQQELIQHSQIGQTMLLAVEKNSGRVLFNDVPYDVDFDQLRSRYNLNDQKLLFAIVNRGTNGVLYVTPNANTDFLTHNLEPVPVGENPFLPLDVIQYGTVRLEIMKPGEPALRCPKSSCGLLNDYLRDRTCRFCGHALSEGDTAVYI
jgi:hypothetical protein